MLFLEGCYSVVAHRLPLLSWIAESWVRVWQRLRTSQSTPTASLVVRGGRLERCSRCVAFPNVSVILLDLLFFPLVTNISPSLSSEGGKL